MAGAPAGLPAGIRLSDHISLGVIAKTFPPDRVRQALAETGKASERERDLPAQVTVYYAIALALYMTGSTREVLRYLLEGLRWLWGAEAVRVAGKSGISQARTRLGAAPLCSLYEQVVHPVATHATKGAWYRTWRLVSLGGSCLGVADTAENDAVFGRPGASRGESAFPQLRFVALVENGTHVLFGARLGGFADGETTLAHAALAALRPGMLCLADRQFFGHAVWQAAAATGAELLWRVKRNLRLPREARIVLRGRTPALVRQEFWGLLLAHFAIRGLMHEAALRADEDPDRLSFLHAVRVVRRKLPLFAALSPSGQDRPA